MLRRVTRKMNRREHLGVRNGEETLVELIGGLGWCELSCQVAGQNDFGAYLEVRECCHIEIV